MTRTNFKKVVEFNDTFGGAKDFQRQFELVIEELMEVLREIPNTKFIYEMQAILTEDHVIEQLGRLVKEIVDLLYVTYGMLYALRVDADTVFDMVHRSNMSKVGDDGKPIKDEKTGKILKGPNYEPVDPKRLFMTGAYMFVEKFNKCDIIDEYYKDVTNGDQSVS